MRKKAGSVTYKIFDQEYWHSVVNSITNPLPPNMSILHTGSMEFCMLHDERVFQHDSPTPKEKQTGNMAGSLKRKYHYSIISL